VAKLDLQDPEAIKELKGAMASAPFMLPFVFGDDAEGDFTGDFFQDNEVWGLRETKFARFWWDAYDRLSANTAGLFVYPHLYPSVKGVLEIMGVLGYGVPKPPLADFANFPHLTAFVDELQGDPKRGSLVVPFVSDQDLEGSALPLKTGTIALVVIGLFGLVLSGFVFGGSTKKR
jgi:hypothetical protein